ncbi:MAG: hypothetical protein ACPGRX_03020, partial [Bdellovibrionales bacterium]
PLEGAGIYIDAYETGNVPQVSFYQSLKQSAPLDFYLFFTHWTTELLRKKKFERAGHLFTIESGTPLAHQAGIKEALAEITFRIVTDPTHVARIVNGKRPKLKLPKPGFDAYRLVGRISDTVAEMTGQEDPFGIHPRETTIPRIQEKTKSDIVTAFQAAVGAIDFPADSALEELAEQVVTMATDGAQMLEGPRESIFVDITAKRTLLLAFHEMSSLTTSIAQADREHQALALKTLSDLFRPGLETLAHARIQAANNEIAISAAVAADRRLG